MDVAGIERELTAMWRASAEGGDAVVRACTHNLVVACGSQEQVKEVSADVARVSASHPGRAIVIVRGGPGVSGLDAWVSAHCTRGAGGARVCNEQVTLVAGSDAEELVPGTVLQILAEDVPVVVWWRRTLVVEDPILQPLAAIADRFLVNSARHLDPRGALRALSSAASRPSHGAIGDLTWVRLESWRDLVASFFDGPGGVESLRRITAVEVVAGGSASASGATVAAAYVAGWLAARLGWTPTRDVDQWSRPGGGSVRLSLSADPRVEPGRVALVRIHAADTAGTARFEAERVAADSHDIRLSVSRPGGSPRTRVERLLPPDDAVLLAAELERDAVDPMFTEALQIAARLLG